MKNKPIYNIGYVTKKHKIGHFILNDSISLCQEKVVMKYGYPNFYVYKDDRKVNSICKQCVLKSKSKK